MSSLLAYSSSEDDDDDNAVLKEFLDFAEHSDPPTYGSIISSPTPTSPPPPPPQSLLSNLLHLMNTDSSTPSSPNNTVAAATADSTAATPLNNDELIAETETSHTLAASDKDSSTGEKIEQEGDTNENESTNSSPLNQNILNMIIHNGILTPLINRILSQKVLADKLLQYPILLALSQNGRYASLAFIAIYAVSVLLIWFPLWLLSLLITEVGVYLLLLTSGIYGGRCLLRLLAFPGTNVRVYGEIENEFAKYSCKMLEGGAGAIEDFAKSLRNGGAASQVMAASEFISVGLDSKDDDGWDIVDVPATYKRVLIYKNRVFGVFWEVLYCLLEENGQGYDSTRGNATDAAARAASGDRNGFYRLGENISACRDKCKIPCCERKPSNGGDQVEAIIQMDAQNNELRTPVSSPTNSGSLGGGRRSHYGNNPLIGDIGTMGNLTVQAKADGRELYVHLTSLLNDFAALEASSSNVLRIMDDKDKLKEAKISDETMELATKLLQRASDLREFVSRIKLSSDDENDAEDEAQQQQDEETEVGADAVRHRLEEQGTAASSSSMMGMVKSTVQAFVSMIDPPPHKSIFGLDVIRGSFLARYHGAKQFWVKRGGSWGGDGKLDVIMIPSTINNGVTKDSSIENLLPLSPRKGREEDIVSPKKTPEKGIVGEKIRRAVLYCNPNAGLVEVATGMGLTGGNVGEQDKDDEEKEPPTCWTEYYIEHGYDVYLFNYAGYGRSYGGSSWNETTTEFSHGFFGAVKRVLFSTFLAFKPSSESLKSDAAVVARHLVDIVGVDELIIHGESIGGMAAAGAARALTSTSATPKSTTTFLICDRTFCNLNAVAQRLVGQWTGSAIHLLTPGWSTDVARDFLAAKCPKLVAQDAADEIIHDYSSLKSGLSFAGELTKGITTNVGWVVSPPIEFRVADLDNVSISKSRVSCNMSHVKNPPTWPADKHISWSESWHFATCAKRIGKLATAAKKQMQARLKEVEEGIEVSLHSSSESSQLSLASSNRSSSMQVKSAETKVLMKLWNSLACCDGLCGHPLGHAVKEGFDSTISWLCCAVVFGGQVLAEEAEKRWDNEGTSAAADESRVFLPADFDSGPKGQWDEDDLAKHPLPIPVVLSSLKCTENVPTEVEAEVNYVIGMLEYIVSRLTSKESSDVSLRRRNGCEDEQGVISTGCFLNLHCGHNNQYSTEEREKLIAFVRRSCGDSV